MIRDWVWLAHVALMLVSAALFDRSHWWFLLGVASTGNLARLTWQVNRDERRNDAECDEFVRRHYRL